MLVFISWSGERSRHVAEHLRYWLKDVIHQIEPWVSSEDIRQGSRWNVDVARRLQDAAFGILCLTKENLSEPWLLFEAGALAKALDQSLVCPYLIDIKPTELQGPLVQFQAARAIETDTRKLVLSINKSLGKNALPDDLVDRACRKWWPDLENALKGLPQPRTTAAEPRPDRELLEEVLNRVRRIEIGGFDADFRTESDAALLQVPHDLFEGDDVRKLLRRVAQLGLKDDANATLWSVNHQREAKHRLDGLWSTRWGGGAAHDGWVSGLARVQVFGMNLYALTHDGRADCLIAARLSEDGRLAGRYINLGSPTEVLAWVGKVVDENRIDGFWTQGRWDLRRG